MGVYTEPGLRAGWEPDTPPADTLLRRYLLNLAESNLALVRALGGRTLQRDAVAAADLGRPTGLLLNTAVLLRPLDGASAGQLLDALDEFYGAGGTGAVTLFSAWPTPDLRGRGWRLEGHPPLLVRPPADPAAADHPANPPGHPADPPGQQADEPGEQADQPGDLSIVPVDGRQRVEDWCRVAVEGFPFSELQPYRAGSLLDERVLAERRLRLWVGYRHDRPVCASSLFQEHGLGQFWLSATRPEARGRGCYRAMVRHRLAAAPGLVLAGLFSDLSRPTVEREAGFLPLTRFTLWSRSRPAREGG